LKICFAFKKTKMKNLLLIFLFVTSICLTGCNSKKKSEEIKNYTYQENQATVNDHLKGKVGSWVEERTVCYGLIVSVNAQGKVVKGLPVRAMVVEIKPDSIKMKALENVSLAEIKGCKKMGIAKGETWWETEGDLYKTKDEAITFLKGKGWMD